MRKRTDKNIKNVALGILLGIVLVAGIVFGALVLFDQKGGGSVSDDETSVSEDEYVSKEEQTGDDNEAETPAVDVDSGKKKLNISVDADYVGGVIEAYSTVYGTVDTSGKCTFLFVAPDGSSASVETEALTGPSTVTCARAEFRTSVRGSWKVTLKYETGDAIGEGNATVIVQ